MNVKVKSKDYVSATGYFIPAIIIFLLCGSIFLFAGESSLAKEKGFLALFSSKIGILLVFTALFLILGFFIVIKYFLPPKEEEAVLIAKDVQRYMGKNICLMIFEPLRSQQSGRIKITCPCYTEKDNELQTGKTYRILTQQYNNQILRVMNPECYPKEEAAFTERRPIYELNEKQMRELMELQALSPITAEEIGMQKPDAKYLENAGITVPAVTDISSCIRFEIITPSLKLPGKSVFYLADGLGQMIYQFSNDLTHPFSYNVSDIKGNPVAKIEYKPLQGFLKYQIQIVNGKTFTVKPSVTTALEYEITGSDYVVIGREKGRFAPANIFTADGHLMAELNPSDEKKEMNIQKINMNYGCIANTELLLLICCIAKIAKEDAL